jgi:hypothetical protein
MIGTLLFEVYMLNWSSFFNVYFSFINKNRFNNVLINVKNEHERILLDPFSYCYS